MSSHLRNDGPETPAMRDARRVARRVVAATVTYGERGHLCMQVVERALALGVQNVVVVLNGVTGSAGAWAEDLADRNPRVVLVYCESNNGSAEGFTAAIQAALRLECDFVWLLDDDNVPEEHSLSPLIAGFESVFTGSPVALFSFRPSEHFQRQLVDGRDRFPGPGSFMYFDAFNRRGREETKALSALAIAVPYGPYGGMFGPRSLFELGLPLLDLGLYEDDTEYTLRLAALGASLYLCPLSVVRDIDGKWSEGSKASGPMRLLASESVERRRLAVRNRIFVDMGRARGQRCRFAINVTVYVLALCALAVRARRLDDLVAVLRAMLEGSLLRAEALDANGGARVSASRGAWGHRRAEGRKSRRECQKWIPK